MTFVCEHAPEVFLERLGELSWLRRDVDLVAAMVGHLSPGTEEQNGTLLLVLAADGRMAELERLASWERTLTEANVDAALQAASAAGHAESAAWLRAHRPRSMAGNTGAGGLADLDDLLL